MSYNNLAQNITAQGGLQSAGTNLYFAAAGGDAVVSIAAIDENGLPADTLAQVRVGLDSIKLAGQPTTVLWPQPLLLQQGTSYALCVACADADTQLQVAKIGAANMAGGLVTAAQAAIGALVHINPSGVVTKQEGRMLRFDMLAASYTAQQRSVVLGTVDVENAASLTINAGAQQPEAAARISYLLELLDNAGNAQQTITVDTAQPVRLPAVFTGAVRITATLRVGAAGLGAVLEPGTVLVVGQLNPEGTYISPAITTGGGDDLRVIYEAEIPAGSAVEAHVQTDGANDWTPVPFDSSSNAAGVVEVRHRLQGIAATAQRLRLTISGSTNARPKLRNLRAVYLG